jgi:hypothetical protein
MNDKSIDVQKLIFFFLFRVFVPLQYFYGWSFSNLALNTFIFAKDLNSCFIFSRLHVDCAFVLFLTLIIGQAEQFLPLYFKISSGNGTVVDG